MSNLKIPRTERLEETHKRKDGALRAVTANKDRSKWYWNEVKADGTIERIQTAKSPSEFNRKNFFKNI